MCRIGVISSLNIWRADSEAPLAYSLIYENVCSISTMSERGPGILASQGIVPLLKTVEFVQITLFIICMNYPFKG